MDAWVMKGATLLSLAVVLAARAPAAGVTQQWVARYDGSGNGDDKAVSVAVDTAGNVYATGYSTDTDGDIDYVTVKYSPEGVELWAARYDGSSGGVDGARMVVVDSSGNAYVTGGSGSASGTTDIATIKYSSAGAELWVARYDGPGHADDSGTALVVDPWGRVTVTGESEEVFGRLDYVTIKYAADGAPLWEARWDDPGRLSDIPDAMVTDDEGNVIVTGFGGNRSGQECVSTIKYEPNGMLLWVTQSNDPATFSDHAQDMAVDSSGNVFVTGTGRTSSSSWNWDPLTIKYSPDGVEQWRRFYRGPLGWMDGTLGIVVDELGNAYVTGGVHTATRVPEVDTLTIKYSTDGIEEWVASQGGAGGDRGNAVALDACGNLWVTGSTHSDYLLLVYAPNGTKLWEGTYNGTGDGYDEAVDITADQAGYVYVTGSSTGVLTEYDFTTIKYFMNRPPVTDAGGPYAAQCDALGARITLDATASRDLDGDPMTFSWTSDCPGANFDDERSPCPVLTVAGTAPCPGECSVTLTASDGAGCSSTDTERLAIEDTVPPDASCALEPVRADEDEDGDGETVVPGLFTVRLAGKDACDPAPTLSGTLALLGEDEACDSTPDSGRYPVEDGDLVRLVCAHKRDCARHADGDEDGDVTDVALNLKGPGLAIEVVASDACGNVTKAKCIEECDAGRHAFQEGYAGRASSITRAPRLPRRGLAAVQLDTLEHPQ